MSYTDWFGDLHQFCKAYDRANAENKEADERKARKERLEREKEERKRRAQEKKALLKEQGGVNPLDRPLTGSRGASLSRKLGEEQKRLTLFRRNATGSSQQGSFLEQMAKEVRSANLFTEDPAEAQRRSYAPKKSATLHPGRPASYGGKREWTASLNPNASFRDPSDWLYRNASEDSKLRSGAAAIDKLIASPRPPPGTGSKPPLAPRPKSPLNRVTSAQSGLVSPHPLPKTQSSSPTPPSSSSRTGSPIAFSPPDSHKVTILAGEDGHRLSVSAFTFEEEAPAPLDEGLIDSITQQADERPSDILSVGSGRLSIATDDASEKKL